MSHYIKPVTQDGAKVDDYLGSDAAEVKAKIEANIPAELATAISSTPSGAGENYLAHWVFKVRNLKIKDDYGAQQTAARSSTHHSQLTTHHS